MLEWAVREEQTEVVEEEQAEQAGVVMVLEEEQHGLGEEEQLYTC